MAPQKVMDRTIGIEGLAFRLRPMRMEDAAFIFSLRDSSDERLKFLQNGPKTLADQQKWQESYEQRDNDCCYIVERISSGQPEGTAALYNYDESRGAAEWGRWILRPGSKAAVETAYLIYKLGMELFKLDYIYGITNMENVRVVAFHDRSGIPFRGKVQRTVTLGGITSEVDCAEHGCFRHEWPERGETLRQAAEKFAQVLATS